MQLRAGIPHIAIAYRNNVLHYSEGMRHVFSVATNKRNIALCTFMYL